MRLSVLASLMVFVIPMNAFGAVVNLVATNNSDVKTSCYSPNHMFVERYSCNGGSYCPTECFFFRNPDEYNNTTVPSCPSSKNDDSSPSICTLGTYGNYMVVCSYGHFAPGGVINSKTGTWTTFSAAKHTVSRVVCNISNKTASADGYISDINLSAGTEYGCEANYYTTGGRSSSMTCTACPANATCGSAGNAEVFKCNDGYYRNGSATTCSQCPSSGGITAKTGKTGATSQSECYIPSGGAFSDSTGSGSYTGDCYY